MADSNSDSTSYSSLHNLYPSNYHQDNISQHSGDADQESLDNDYPSGYHHSIHRLSQLSNRGNLKKAFDARTGGTTRRNLGKNNQKGLLLEKHANIIVSKMEQDEALMEDSPDAEELRRTALRDMPQCLTIKRCVKVKLSKSVSQKSKRKHLSYWKMFKYRLSMSWTKLKINIRDLAYSFELWYGPLKKIEGNFGTGVASFFKFLRSLFLINLVIAIFSIGFITIPRTLVPKTIIQDAPAWGMEDLLSGEGYLTNTLLYYGFYTDENVSDNSVLSYSMPYAYFFTMLFIYFACFAVVGISAAKSYRRSFIETEGGLKNVFANKIFCGWDYNIATKDAAELKRKAIFNELRELIWDFTQSKHNETFHQKFLTRTIQFFMNLVILFMISGMAYAIWYFLNNVPTERSYKIIVAPLFINSVMALMPMFLSFLVKYEDYKSPKTALYVTLARTFLLGAVCVGVLAGYWLTSSSSTSCWETSLAQEFYRMIVWDFIISILLTALLDIVMYFFYKYLRKDVYLEFDIAWNTMQIIYNQTLFWVGLVFSPLLPVVVVIKLFLCWYIRFGIVMVLCKPSSKTWRAAQTSTWFLAMTFLSMILIGGLLGYIVSYIPVSKDCGPFRNYDYIYELVTEGVFRLKTNSSVWWVVLYATKPGVIALILIFLSAKVYYSKAQACAQKEIVEQCRNMLIWSAKDKEYYYALISRVTKGQWQYRFHDRAGNPEFYEPGDVNNDETAEPFEVPSTSKISSDIDPITKQYSRHKKYT
ncbi:unnamed protein product [Ceutorhynchus assimilis]|uniref:TMC domain-containing protein n=1 Tax=Ceutorhynchus assimilis TaxID=467358 RepID=A0A9N9MQ47_9CUCU|nr:unnamed protein product [Ceutorhynchus assimilis]